MAAGAKAGLDAPCRPTLNCRQRRKSGVAMDDDELQPLRTGSSERVSLEFMSVEELEAYIGRLETEIARARAQIEEKRSSYGSAEALFKGRL